MIAERPAVLRAEGLDFGFAGHPVFNGLNLSIPAGVTWVGGDESTGKTTLLRLLAGDLEAGSGTFAINGIALNQRAQTYRDQVFWVDLGTDAFDSLTPQAYWDRLPKPYPTFDSAVLTRLVQALGLTAHLHKSMYMLSTGTKRKIFLAASFAASAAVTMIDEPFAALDKASIDAVLELLRDAAQDPNRACVVADYLAPRGIPLTGTVVLKSAGNAS